MKEYIKHDEWCIIEEGFVPEYNRISESLFSIGNGWMGQRANFEEKYSGDTLQGSYVAGVYYPDKTRVGWWKNGYPEYFAKVLNSVNWIGIDIQIEGEDLDLATSKISSFKRVLDMKEGVLRRSFVAEMPNGRSIEVHAERFVSAKEGELGAIKYEINPLDFDGTIELRPYMDFDVVNEDSNYDEKFWVEEGRENDSDKSVLVARTKKTDFWVSAAMGYEVLEGTTKLAVAPEFVSEAQYVAQHFKIQARKGTTYTIYKYAAVLSSMNHEKAQISSKAVDLLNQTVAKGYHALLDAHRSEWARTWENSDVVIEGDVAAQQGIRFNIFQLHQTYNGHDERLNIGPKGFTGEKYGGSTYWDTEAYCLPFYLSTARQEVAKNLLVYRYKHLPKAIENAEKLGFTNGAALYPMVTMNGEECHNEWEITFEEIHRNGAIAFAIYDYIRYTGDAGYLSAYGLEVLVGIARFWAQRVNFSEDKKQYVMLGVTGPNEYENNVNNNWYTSTIATWSMKYTMEAIAYVKAHESGVYQEVVNRLKFAESEETSKWKDIVDNMYYPYNEELDVFMQQDGYMDKEQIMVDDLAPADRPINQKWSWDRILRSCFIKQADVLQGIYLFEDDYPLEQIKSNYDFYEPRTVHESSLSPCVHSILAARLGYEDKAYEHYLRTSRLDLDDYNNDTEDGLHITSMAGSWMSIVQGFAGMRVRDGKLHFHPFSPREWKSYAFKIGFRGHLLRIRVNKHIEVQNLGDTTIQLHINDKELEVPGQETVIV